MPESWRTRLYRWFFNLFPAYRGTGAWITYIAADWREIRVKLPLSWQTRNYVGTIFGGSMYAAVDPMYMIMLIKNLGPDYIVWDKAASIRFKRPGRSTLYARFLLAQSELEAIRTALQEENHLNRMYHIDLKDNQGKVCATVEKTVYVAHKRPTNGEIESGR
jgi:acyl-coenzyme A thioesterase PaaI-like protein